MNNTISSPRIVPDQKLASPPSTNNKTPLNQSTSERYKNNNNNTKNNKNETQTMSRITKNSEPLKKKSSSNLSSSSFEQNDNQHNLITYELCMYTKSNQKKQREAEK
jgi:hypothetical protein